MRIVPYILALAACATAAAQEWRTPEITGRGKELPRSGIVSYPSRDEALVGSLERTKYYQPIELSVEERNGDRIYSGSYAMPFAWIDRRVFLHIESAGASFSVEVGGNDIGYSQDGRTAAEFDITDYCKDGRNQVVVTVHGDAAAAEIEDALPAAAPLQAYVVSQPRVRVRDIVIDTRADHGNGLFALGVILKSHMLNPKDYRVYYELIDPAGEVVSYGHRDLKLDMRREDTVRFLANIPSVMAWSHEAPYLYTVAIKTQYEGRYGEYLTVPVGFRKLAVDDGVLSVNDIPVELHAADFSTSSGIASTAEQLRQLKAQGYNTVRAAAPQPESFYELCDRIGLYVIDCAGVNTSRHGQSRRRGGNPSNDPRWEAAYVDRAVSTYHSSKNHPSAVAFSIASDASNGYCLYESYLVLKALETARPVLYPDASGEWNSDLLKADSRPATESAGARVTVSPAGDDSYTVRNLSELAPVEVVAVYTVRVGRSTVAEGEIPLRLAAGTASTITVPTDKVKAGKSYSTDIRIEQPEPQYNYVHHIEDRTPQPEKTRAGQIVSSVRDFFRYKPDADASAAPRTLLTEASFNASKPAAGK